MTNLKTCNKAIKADPDNAALYLRRGANYQGEGDYARAVADYTKAIDLNPYYAHAYYLRGLSKYRRKDYLVDKADIIKDLENAIELGSPVAGRLMQELQNIKIKPYAAVLKWLKTIPFKKKRKEAKTKIGIIRTGLDICLQKESHRELGTA